MVWIVDADDFHEGNQCLNLFHQTKLLEPGFKITLFTVPGLCSLGFLESVRKLDWIDMVPHGWLHPHPRECELWTYEEAMAYLDRIEGLKLTKGFKAPGWQISDGTYRALLERGYWVADQAYNNRRRPKDLKAYILDEPHRVHFHVGSWNGQTMQNSLDVPAMRWFLRSLHGEFGFVRDFV